VGERVSVPSLHDALKTDLPGAGPGFLGSEPARFRFLFGAEREQSGDLWESAVPAEITSKCPTRVVEIDSSRHLLTLSKWQMCGIAFLINTAPLQWLARELGEESISNTDEPA